MNVESGKMLYKISKSHPQREQTMNETPKPLGEDAQWEAQKKNMDELGKSIDKGLHDVRCQQGRCEAEKDGATFDSESQTYTDSQGRKRNEYFELN